MIKEHPSIRIEKDTTGFEWIIAGPIQVGKQK